MGAHQGSMSAHVFSCTISGLGAQKRSMGAHDVHTPPMCAQKYHVRNRRLLESHPAAAAKSLESLPHEGRPAIVAAVAPKWHDGHGGRSSTTAGCDDDRLRVRSWVL
jgi:hypothetical protein